MKILLSLIFFVIFGCVLVQSSYLERRFRRCSTCSSEEDRIIIGDREYFYYFGYGSNMLAARIHIKNPTAVRMGVGKLNNHRLDFYGYSKTWNGAPATIYPNDNSVVYGAIWAIESQYLSNLDRQEGVYINKYKPMIVPVETADGIIMCRTYSLVNQPSTTRGDIVPYDRQPSKTYLKTLIKGAIETKIPRWYRERLRNFKHNDNRVQELENQLELGTIRLYT